MEIRGLCSCTIFAYALIKQHSQQHGNCITIYSNNHAMKMGCGVTGTLHQNIDL